MAPSFNLGETLSRAAHTAGGIAKGASAAVESAAKGAANAAEGAGKAIVNTAASASKMAGAAMCSVAEGSSNVGEQIASSGAGKAIAGAANAVGGIAVDAAMGLAQGASSLASGAASTAEGGINAIKENSFSARLRRARIKGFRDGIKQGAYLAGQKRHNFIYAYVATLFFLMRCDGDFSQEEREWLEDGLDYLKLDGGLPDDVKAKVQAIADDEDLSFDRVKDCLDNISIVSLGSIAEQLQVAAAADGQVTEEEEHACRLFADYMAARAACVAVDESWAEQAVEKSVREYGENLERIDREFKERTRLQDADAAFVVAATMLQVARVLVINSLTEVERAGAGNAKEDALHSFQDRVFSGFDDGAPAESGRLFASKSHILSSRGVPYDATRYEAENLKIFKGANHRFATLGHDPVLGLVFGTSNIMTNSITCVRDANVFGIGARIPATYSVSYDAFGKNPLIGAPTGTVEMLVAAGRRVVSEPDAAAAALIKQLVHIGTDLYTPCGIQIPFANLVLDKAYTEALTKYVSTGDVLKVGVQAGMTALINWLIAALHGCSLIFNDDGSDYCTEMYQARTKKIILISDTIATSSSVVQALITENPKCLDLGGATVLVYRLFSDARFVAKLKEEYVQSELDKIYDKRAKGLL
ncbi:hypothetical protein [Ellagibacter sp.]|uniref:tellurite resistance TerB family protein n=1 Tax=Ellagibacter sp. TaxID=2137578 RepID=UPI003AB67282